jgi:hypothetical protein
MMKNDLIKSFAEGFVGSFQLAGAIAGATAKVIFAFASPKTILTHDLDKPKKFRSH